MRAHQIITETVEEQRDIIKMAQKIINWYKNTVGDMRTILKKRQELNPQSQNQNPKEQEKETFDFKNFSDRYFFDSTNRLNSPIELRDVVGRNYASETVRKWLSSKPAIIFATEENLEYGITTEKLKRASGWWSVRRNLIVISCINPQSLFDHSNLSTIIHEIQHGLDSYKSKSLVYMSSKGGRGGSTTRAQQEVADIQIILAAFKKKLRSVGKSDILVKNIISAEMLQSDIFKKLANDPEFANIKIASPKNWDNPYHSDEDYSSPKTPIEELFWWMPDCLIHESSEEFFYRLQDSLITYRFNEYNVKKGYTDKFQNYDAKQSNYYSRNVEINARILQAFHRIVDRLKTAGFRGYSSNPEINKQQKEIIWQYVNQTYKANRISKELWPKNNQEERWRRLDRRLQQFIKQNFPRNSNVLPKTEKQLDDESTSSLSLFKLIFPEKF